MRLIIQALKPILKRLIRLVGLKRLNGTGHFAINVKLILLIFLQMKNWSININVKVVIIAIGPSKKVFITNPQATTPHKTQRPTNAPSAA